MLHVILMECLVDVEDAISGGDYHCPSCGAQVIVKDGKVNAKHFAHVAGVCTDNWHYDMSEWHRRMQKYFPKNSREIVVTDGKRIHRADVLIKKTVIEIQHSPISAEEFAERNEFFHSLGYKIVWIFDVSEPFEQENLYFYSDENPWKMAWKHPMRIFSAGPKPSDYNYNYAVWLYLGDDEKDDYILKVVWSIRDEYGPDFSRIVVSDFPISLGEYFEIDDFLDPKKKRVEKEIKKLTLRSAYTVKWSGIKGKRKDEYVCPKTNQFGIKLYGIGGCKYCKHCYMILKRKRKEAKTETQAYCCFPNKIQEDAEAPIYETHDI